jgi:hypothetical protein
MIEVTVQIDDTRFRLGPTEDVPRLQALFRQAVRAPAAFVSFAPLGYAKVSVLVSPATRVRFDTVSRADYASDSDAWTTAVEWEPEIEPPVA